MKKIKKVSKEDYQKAQEKLDWIQKEKETLEHLSSTGNYQAHIQLAKSFQELLINIKRDNIEITRKIEKYKREAVSLINLNINFSEYKELKESIENIMELGIITEEELLSYLNGIKGKMKGSTSTENNTLVECYLSIIDLNERKQVNEYLYDYISELMESESVCLDITRRYQKQTTKMSKQANRGNLLYKKFFK